MAPLILQPGAGEVGGVTHGSGVRRLDRPSTPPGIHAPPPDDLDLETEEGEDMATNAERIAALEEGQKELMDTAHRLELGQETARGERALQSQQIATLVADTGKIPAIEKKADDCVQNTTQILAILKGNGMVAPMAADASSPGTVAVNNPTAQLVHFLMPVIKQLPPQIVLLLLVWLIFFGGKVPG